jgi:serine/threonine-protein kinase
VVIDAAGPLAADSLPGGRAVPLGGDAPDVTTAVGRSLPGDGVPAKVPESERRARMLLAGLDQRTRAIVQVAVGDRCEVSLPGDDEAMLDAVRERRPDLVVLDWNAPELAPRDLLDDLRTDPVTRESKVLLVVRDKQARSREVVRADADEILATPFSPLQLQVKLRKLLGADAVAI